MPEMLKVTMLGSFCIRKGEKSVDDRSNRMRKVWLLLAYLIYSRSSHTTQESYLSLLRGAKATEEIDDPSGRLKALFYRVRTMLDGVYQNAGHDLIIRKNGTYAWNTDIPMELDVEEFDRLCSAASAAQQPEKLSLLLQALNLYKGDFLPKLSSEPWVMPISAYYHQLYLDCAQEALTLLAEEARFQEVVELSQKALTIEPYSEELYQHLMRAHLALEDRAKVQTVYEQMSEVLFDTFGVMPSDESRQLYREASRQTNHSSVSAATVREQLREPSEAKGAMFCEYDFFKLLYQVQARAMLRSGDTVHIALLSLHGILGKELSRRSLDIAMENLQELIVSSLRQGDVVTKCSKSQFIIMLPQANYENSCAVCERILKAFNRQYPHSPAEIHYHVQPLEPMAPGMRIS